MRGDRKQSAIHSLFRPDSAPLVWMAVCIFVAATANPSLLCFRQGAFGVRALVFHRWPGQTALYPQAQPNSRWLMYYGLLCFSNAATNWAFVAGTHCFVNISLYVSFSRVLWRIRSYLIYRCWVSAKSSALMLEEFVRSAAIRNRPEQMGAEKHSGHWFFERMIQPQVVD